MDHLTFEVAPNIVQDLGLNLYTSVARALVEFVANAFDADSPFASITLDDLKISAARLLVKQQWEREKLQRAAGESSMDESIVPLNHRAR
jgi:hypothetical protein